MNYDRGNDKAAIIMALILAAFIITMYWLASRFT